MYFMRHLQAEETIATLQAGLVHPQGHLAAAIRRGQKVPHHLCLSSSLLAHRDYCKKKLPPGSVQVYHKMMFRAPCNHQILLAGDLAGLVEAM